MDEDRGARKYGGAARDPGPGRFSTMQRSEGSDGDNLEDVEVVVIGFAGEADLSFDAGAEG